MFFAFDIIAILLIIMYFFYIRWVQVQWNNIPSIEVANNYQPKTNISVIIPVRNESKYIQKCIQSLLDCHYPDKKLEIIIIDDHSEDDTVQIINQFNHPSIKLLHLKEYIQSNSINAYKKAALQFGIKNAIGNLIITTDGDSHVKPGFLKTYAFHFEHNSSKLLAAPVQFEHPHSFIEKFQVFDMVSMMGITGAGIQAQKYYLANGANLGFDKQAFLRLDAFKENDSASGDDMFLIQSMAKKYKNEVHYLKSKDAIVTTEITHSYADFWEQRKRWASKSKQYKEQNIKFLMVFIFIVNMFPVFSLFLAFFTLNSYLFGLSLLFFLLKYIIDLSYIKKMKLFFNVRSKHFFKAYLFYFVYLIYTASIGMFPRKYQWKKRKVF